MLSEWLDVPYEKINYLCKGVNHQAFYTKLEYEGEDLYPKLKKLLENSEFYDKEQVRNEMFLKLGYYVTESSGHNSEYNQWFRKRPDLIEKYCTHGTGWNPGHYAYILNEYRKRENTWLDEAKKWFDEPLNLERGHEYAASIFNSRITSRS